MTACVVQAITLISYSSDFQCLADEGAVLVLPKGSTLYEARNMDQLRIHASRHGLNWYKWTLNQGIEISNGGLYLITGFVKSDIANFYARPTANNDLRFIFDDDGGSYRGHKIGLRPDI